MYFKRNVLKLCKFQAPVFVSVLIQTALQSATSKQAATGYQKKQGTYRKTHHREKRATLQIKLKAMKKYSLQVCSVYKQTRK